MKAKIKSQTKTMDLFGKRYDATIYQCPVCKEWFESSVVWGSWNRWTDQAVKLHISKMAKIEVFARELGDTKKAPHFDFYKKNTHILDLALKPRDWNF